MVKAKDAVTFGDYLDAFVVHIMKNFKETCSRVGIVLDCRKDPSIKNLMVKCQIGKGRK